MKWIRLEDELPPQDGTTFLGYDPNSDSDTIYAISYDICDKCYREACGECYYKWEPTHWMPLPEPPKE